MASYLKQSLVRLVWTEVNLNQFTPRQIRALASFTEGMSAALEPALEQFRKAYPPTVRDKQFAQEFAYKKEKGSVLQAGLLEEAAIQHHGTVRYSDENVYFSKANGEIEVFPMSIIPLPTEGRPRPGLSIVVGTFGNFCKCVGPTFELNVKVNVLQTVWASEASVLRPAAVIGLLDLLKNTIQGSDVWAGMSLIQKQSLTGARWVSFLMTFFAECSWGDYFSVHTWLALNFFKCFRKGNFSKPYQHILDDGKVERTIPAKALVIIQKSDASKLSEGAKVGAKVVRDILGRDPIVVRGPLDSAHVFVDPLNPTFDKAYKAMQKGDVVRGGDNAGGSILADALGFSGFVTPVTKGLVLTTALALFLTSKVPELDIQCDSIGDVPLVHQSIVNFRDRITNRCDVRYVVMLKSLNDVHKDYKGQCLTAFRAGSHRLYVSKRVIPSGKKTDEIVEKAEEELHTLSEKTEQKGESFTYYGPAYGMTPFRSGRYLYKFGVPSSFRAIVSTFPDLGLYGAHVSKDGRALEPIITDLPCITTPEKWYETVIRANSFKNAYFLRAARQYSPISNLLTPPTKGVKFTLRGDAYEVGETGEADTFDDWESESEEDDYYNQPSGDGGEGEEVSTEEEDDEESEEQETTAQVTTATTEKESPVVQEKAQEALPDTASLSSTSSVSSSSTSSSAGLKKKEEIVPEKSMARPDPVVSLIERREEKQPRSTKRSVPGRTKTAPKDGEVDPDSQVKGDTF